MSRKLVAGNWKMNLTAADGASLVEGVLPTARTNHGVDILFCPSFTVLHAIRDKMSGPNLFLGGQDLFWEPKGAYTGEISTTMLLDSGCSYCIVGHSERRGRFGKPPEDERITNYFSDSDFAVNKKIRALIFASITPILCIGETESERNEGNTESVIAQQFQSALEGFDKEEFAEFAIAYEPVWAIGTGNSCEAEEANRICGIIKSHLDEFGILDRTRVLYGGSVTAKNCKELFSKPNIDGALVGGASLKSDEFSSIISAAN